VLRRAGPEARARGQRRRGQTRTAGALSAARATEPFLRRREIPREAAEMASGRAVERPGRSAQHSAPRARGRREITNLICCATDGA
jgi:hypothetical protein